MSQSPQSVMVNDIDTNCAAATSRISNKMSINEANDSAASIHHARSLVFELAGLVGELSSTFLRKVPLDPPFEALPPASAPLSNDETRDKKDDDSFSISRTNAIDDEEVNGTIGKILLKLIELGHSLSLKLGAVIVQKMQLNARKYPADLCRGKAGKYTEYSSITGITKEHGQSTLHIDANDEAETVTSFLDSLAQYTQDIGNFARDRHWSRYHKPRNLLLALMGELGELAEIFQWRGDSVNCDSISKEDRDKLGQELADVTIYLIRLSDVSNIDLKAAAQAVLEETNE